MVLVLWKASVTPNKDLCAEGFGALCMLCAEIANWVRNWSNAPFCQKSCAPRLLMAGIESGDEKEMYRNFYRNFTAIFRNFTAIFVGLGDRIPPPPPGPRLILPVLLCAVREGGNFTDCKSFIMALHSRRPNELGTGLVDLLLADCIDPPTPFPPPQHLYSHQEGTGLDVVLDDVDNAAKAQALRQPYPMPVGYIADLQPPQPSFNRLNA